MTPSSPKARPLHREQTPRRKHASVGQVLSNLKISRFPLPIPLALCYSSMPSQLLTHTVTPLPSTSLNFPRDRTSSTISTRLAGYGGFSAALGCIDIRSWPGSHGSLVAHDRLSCPSDASQLPSDDDRTPSQRQFPARPCAVAHVRAHRASLPLSPCLFLAHLHLECLCQCA